MYIHCANGHGRSGVFAAIMLVARGLLSDLDEAKKYLKEKRSVINWQEHQQDVAEDVLLMLRKRRKENIVSCVQNPLTKR